jgi:predicted GNAT family acetyltransferase
VALAGRNRSTPHGYCIGPVFTPPQFRGRGYATALTAALSQALLEGGKQFTALFTDLANPTSNSIYQKIGYRPLCDFDEYRFYPSPGAGSAG